MIKPESIPLFTGDLGQLEQHTDALRKEADGIRQAGGEAHRQFQGLSAFYQAPEAEDLFASTKPVSDAADSFGDKVATVADALRTYAAEVAPIAKRLEQLQSQAATFVAGLKTDSGAFDENWTDDADKVSEHQALMHDVNVAQEQFAASEIACNNKITALVGGTQYVMNTGAKQLIPRGAELYGYSADVLDQAKELPWGTPVTQSHDWWDPDDLGYYAKSFFWDGIVVDNVWGTIDGLATLAGFHGSDSAGQAWEGLARAVVGAETYLMESGGQKPTGIFASDFAQESKGYAKEFAKGFVAWDMWDENPSRAAATVVFNGLTLGVGPLKAASAGKAGAAAKTAATVAKVGDVIDPVGAAVKVTGHAIPKIAQVTENLRGVNSIPDLRAPHSVLELSDGSKVVIENGEFIPYDKHGDVVSDVPKQERSAAAEATPESTPVRERELAGVGATSRASESAAGAVDRLPPQASREASSGHGSSETTRSTGPASGRTGATHAGGAGTPAPGHDTASNGRGRPGSGDTSSVGRDGQGPERAAGAGKSEAGSPHPSPHDHEAGADTQDPHQGHDAPDAAEGEGTTPSVTHPHSSSAGDGGSTQGELLPGTARRTLREMRAMNHSRDRYKGAEDYVREMTGGAPERHYRVPSHDHPYYPVQGTGGRNVDVPVDMPDGRTLAVEVKHYLEWRTIKLSDGSTRPVKGEVPLNDGIIEQINKDLTLRRQDPTYDPRWVFLHAPPSQALKNYLIQARIIFIEYGPAPK
ncbi:hypothetical protein [Streptomyces massasporeus]|uniref:hypothetical protein n=1 Tax=Streptomyces massasporeus TaxID=67324 RepID=UPI00199CFEDE|nr:hypothetical protein [Streptomyces massasporeus]GGV66291.1 hypothetical protein GCM10010228_18820 [Streptomyces massasporeus]